MINEILIGLVFLGFFLGFYLREVLEALRKGIYRLEGFKEPEDKKTTFAEPMTRLEVAAMLEEEKIDLLNGR